MEEVLHTKVDKSNRERENVHRNLLLELGTRMCKGLFIPKIPKLREGREANLRAAAGHGT